MTAVLSFFMLSLVAQDRDEIVQLGPALSFGTYKELSKKDGLLTGALPGGEIAVRLAKRIKAWGAYKFSRMEYPWGHGLYRFFRLDAWSGGLRYEPVRLKYIEPFLGAGLNYYHFADDRYTPFVFPVNSAIGPYVQGGTCFQFNSWLKIQCALKYNLMRHTETLTTEYGTYHYRTDFSGLDFSVGLMFCISGRQPKGAI